MKAILIVIAVLVLLYLAVMFLSFAGTMARWFPLSPQRMIPKRAWKKLQPFMQALQDMPQEEVSIKSRDGLKLVGHWITREDAQRTVICVHGFRSLWTIDFAHSAPWLYEERCNLLMIEQRAQGKSEGQYMTYGLKEKTDLEDWIQWCISKSPDHPVYLYGTSMGAATVLMACGSDMPQQIRGAIADSGFTSPFAIVRDVGKRKFHAPLHTNMDIMRLCSRIFAHVDLESYSALEAMKCCRIPVVFIHGLVDTFVPCHMSQENYDACSAPKRLYLFENASHCGSYRKHTLEYQKAVLELFNGKVQ